MINNTISNLASLAKREIKARITHNSSTMYQNDGDLQSFEIERTGNGLFFGGVYNQKVNIKIRDVDNVHTFVAGDSMKIEIGMVNSRNITQWVNAFPTFYITEVHRDENTNVASITAYCTMKRLKDLTFNDLGLEAPYNIEDIVEAIATVANITYTTVNLDDLDALTYTDGANLEGTEKLTDILKYICEVYQAICYFGANDVLTIKGITASDTAVKTIEKADYITLESKTNRRLSAICSVTELSDNIEASTGESGTTFYIRNNPFIELRDDVFSLLDYSIELVGGLTINQFNCDWFGNPCIELGDKIGLTRKDDTVIYSYFLDDLLTYNGALRQKTKWEYKDEESANGEPSTLGEILNKTYARVNKAEKNIQLYVEDSKELQDSVTDLQDSIKNLSDNISTIQTNVTSIEQTASDIKISVKEITDNGVNKIETGMGYTFNDEGLNITKTGSEISTTIDEDGMIVKKNNDEMLVANNQGVDAVNLHAKTYLIIGNNSRFEDYEINGTPYTACFWIGGG